MADSRRYVFYWIDNDGEQFTKSVTALTDYATTDTAVNTTAGALAKAVMDNQPFDTRLSSFEKVEFKSTTYKSVL